MITILRTAQSQPVWFWSEEREVPAAEEEDHRQEADRDDVEVFAEEEHAELHRRIFGVEPADQFLLGFGQVERQPVGLGEPADQEEQES